MTITAGIDVGSSAVKAVLVRHGGPKPEILARRHERLRHRDVREVARVTYEEVLSSAGIGAGDVAYVATTGEGEMVEFRTGHFYGMTAHAKGGVFIAPEAGAVLDVGALHARAIVVDPNGRVLRYRMTSQCASGSGQFMENIGRYLGIALEEIGEISLRSTKPEKCSSICAVLAETDVINMVSRGVAAPDVVKGIHLSMAGRFVKLLEASDARGVVAVTGGLALDVGLLAALREEAARSRTRLEFAAHPDAIHAGAIGAALWAEYRLAKIASLQGALSPGGAAP
jgi:benzoyl-CoA reductase subunit D